MLIQDLNVKSALPNIVTLVTIYKEPSFCSRQLALKKKGFSMNEFVIHMHV